MDDVMSNVNDCQPKNDNEFHDVECPHAVRHSVMSGASNLPRTDQFWTMRLVAKKLPGKRRNCRTVPDAVGVVAKLTHGLSTMSSSQLRMTKPPGPKDMLGVLNNVGVVWSVNNHAHVMFSVHRSLSVMCWNARAHVPNGALSWMLPAVAFRSSNGNPSSKFSVRVPVISVITMLSMTAPSPIDVAFKPSQGSKPPSEKKAM